MDHALTLLVAAAYLLFMIIGTIICLCGGSITGALA
jgi:hypothetical protein